MLARWCSLSTEFAGNLCPSPEPSGKIAQRVVAASATINLCSGVRFDADACRTREETSLSLAPRLREIRSGFEPAFWIANLTELFERLAYYATAAVLAIYLNEQLHFSSRAHRLADRHVWPGRMVPANSRRHAGGPFRIPPRADVCLSGDDPRLFSARFALGPVDGAVCGTHFPTSGWCWQSCWSRRWGPA